jgi:hypothetical protein
MKDYDYKGLTGQADIIVIERYLNTYGKLRLLTPKNRHKLRMILDSGYLYGCPEDLVVDVIQKSFDSSNTNCKYHINKYIECMKGGDLR